MPATEAIARVRHEACVSDSRPLGLLGAPLVSDDPLLGSET